MTAENFRRAKGLLARMTGPQLAELEGAISQEKRARRLDPELVRVTDTWPPPWEAAGPPVAGVAGGRTNGTH